MEKYLFIDWVWKSVGLEWLGLSVMLISSITLAIVRWKSEEGFIVVALMTLIMVIPALILTVLVMPLAVVITSSILALVFAPSMIVSKVKKP